MNVNLYAMQTDVAMTARSSEAGRAAIVVFVDRVACWWLRPLKPGFRHCFAVLDRPQGWLLCDPLKDRIELGVLDVPASFDLPRFYAEQGHRVLLGRTPADRPGRIPLGIAPLTCVVVVKRLLGVRAPWVHTPWQLFRHLTRAGAPRWDRADSP